MPSFERAARGAYTEEEQNEIARLVDRLKNDRINISFVDEFPMSVRSSAPVQAEAKQFLLRYIQDGDGILTLYNAKLLEEFLGPFGLNLAAFRDPQTRTDLKIALMGALRRGAVGRVFDFVTDVIPFSDDEVLEL